MDFMDFKDCFHPAPSEPGIIMTETVNSCSLDLQTVSAELATTKAVCESDTRCTSGSLEDFKPVQPIQPSVSDESSGEPTQSSSVS